MERTMYIKITASAEEVNRIWEDIANGDHDKVKTIATEPLFLVVDEHVRNVVKDCPERYRNVIDIEEMINTVYKLIIDNHYNNIVNTGEIDRTLGRCLEVL